MNNGSGSSRRKRLLVLAALLLICAGWAAWHYQNPLAAALGKWLIVEDPLQPADVVIALAGNTWLRVPEATRLLRQGYGRRLLITLAKPSPWLRQFYERYGRDFSDEALARLVIHSDGLEHSRVELLRGSTSTWTDAQIVRRAWQRRPFRSAILITDPYHLRRARRCFELVFAGTGVAFHSHAAFRLSDNAKIFTDRQDILQYIVTEYLRTAYYYVAH
jgi:uncharacterized SAM-binding protein YcdF (DUF218 family)